LKEKDAVPGDIIQAASGNRYLVMPNGKQLYVGNRNMERVPVEEFVPCRPDEDIEKIAHV